MLVRAQDSGSVVEQHHVRVLYGVLLETRLLDALPHSWPAAADGVADSPRDLLRELIIATDIATHREHVAIFTVRATRFRCIACSSRRTRIESFLHCITREVPK